MRLLPLLSLLLACSGKEPEDSGGDDTDDGGACGDVRTWDVEIRGAVVGDAGDPLSGMTLTLEDRGWTGEDLGSATTGADGEATFTAVGVTDVDGCWGTVLDYWLVASDPSGAVPSTEEDVNSNLYNAIDDGSLVMDLTDYPLTMGP